MRIIKKQGKAILNKELKKSYNFFIKEANTNKKSKGYGLIKDKTQLANSIASIASVGYGLAALIIGVEHKWIKYEKAYERANRTLETFIKNVEGKNGFYYHFINMETGKREWNCEISIIDTAIFICGAITAGEYFGKEVKNKADILYKKIDWEWYRNKTNNLFYMGYKPEIGFWGQWDGYAEQLMMYILGVSSPTHPVDKSMYYEFDRKTKDYKDIKDIIYTYCGTLFTYQYSHAWIDFKNLKDKNGVDWFENSIKATKANREYCIDNRPAHPGRPSPLYAPSRQYWSGSPPGYHTPLSHRSLPKPCCTVQSSNQKALWCPCTCPTCRCSPAPRTAKKVHPSLPRSPPYAAPRWSSPACRP